MVKRGFADTWMLVKNHAIWDLVLLLALAAIGIFLNTKYAGINAVLISLAALFVVTLFVAIGNIFMALFRIYRDTSAELDEVRARLASLEDSTRDKTPQLSFGRAVIPRDSQFIALGKGFETVNHKGRIIRVPVINAQGVGTAKQVHARLRFLSSKGGFGPEQAQAEWYSEHGPVIEIDLPGNGRNRLRDIAVFLDGDYPNLHEWTDHSRAAQLANYAIKANPVDVEIEVMGVGSAQHAPRIIGTLRIDLRSGMLRADWLTGGPENDSKGTNYVRWPS